MHRRRLNWFNLRKLYDYLLAKWSSHIDRLPGSLRHRNPYMRLPAKTKIAKSWLNGDLIIEVNPGILTTIDKKKCYTRSNWLRDIVHCWRYWAKRNAAARVIQRHVVPWLYNPHKEGPMFRKLKACIESGSIGTI